MINVVGLLSFNIEAFHQIPNAHAGDFHPPASTSRQLLFGCSCRDLNPGLRRTPKVPYELVCLSRRRYHLID